MTTEKTEEAVGLLNGNQDGEGTDDLTESVDEQRADGTKTPTTAPPVSTNTRASTRKRRSAAPIFGEQSTASGSIDATPTTDQQQQPKQGPSPAKQRKSGTPKGGKRHSPPRLNLDAEDDMEATPNGDQKPKKNNSNNNVKSEEDPFDFTTQSGVHPEPLKNISIERSSFNEVKFTKSLPSSAERYANVEKIAASRNPQLAASLSASNAMEGQSSLSQLSSLTSLSLRLDVSGIGSSPSGTPKSIMAASRAAANQTGSGRKKRATPRSKVKKEEEEADEEDETDNFRMEIDESQETSKKGSPKLATPKTPLLTLKTPQSRQRQRAEAESKAAEEKKKEAEAELYRVPELSADEQLDVDWPKEGQLIMGAGARVLALWGNEYYAAHICGREAIGRYYVHYVEDELNRVLPPGGVVPLSMLKPGMKLSFIDMVDGEEMGKVSEVVEQPSAEEAEGWKRGEFKLRELDDELRPSAEIRNIPWAKLYLTKEQGHAIQQQLQQQQQLQSNTRKPLSNPTLNVDEENIVTESRTSRRSRNAALARLSSASSTATGPAGDTSLSEATPTPPRTPRAVKATPTATSPRTTTTTTTRSSTRRRGRASPRMQSDAQVEDEAAKEEAKAEEEDHQNMEINGASTEEDEQSPPKKPTFKSPSLNKSVTATPPTRRSPRGRDASHSETPEQTQPKQEDKAEHNQQLISKTIAEAPPEPEESDEAVFEGLKFVLTSATRPNKKTTDFNKRDYRKKIEERGGQIIEDFSALVPDETAYLIADTYYRTHKYLSALSLSVPCVSYKWIQQCVAEKKLTDHKPHLLPSGESSLDPSQQFEWKPLKDILMKGKRVLICSTVAEPDPGTVSFADIWAPILRNLGASLVGIGDGEPFCANSTASSEEKLAFCDKIEPPVDVLLGETDCQSDVPNRVMERGGVAVSSEWVIQAIVSGSLPDLNAPGGERFRYDFV